LTEEEINFPIAEKKEEENAKLCSIETIMPLNDHRTDFFQEHFNKVV